MHDKNRVITQGILKNMLSYEKFHLNMQYTRYLKTGKILRKSAWACDWYSLKAHVF